MDSSTYSQTLNKCIGGFLRELLKSIEILSGPLLVSRTGDEGCSLRLDKVPKPRLSDTMKGVGSFGQQDGGHGSRNSLRSV